MIWIEMSVLVAAGVLSMLVVRVVRRPTNVAELGSVSHHMDRLTSGRWPMTCWSLIRCLSGSRR